MYLSSDTITLTTIQAQATMLQRYVAVQYWHAVCWYMLLFICASMGGIPITILLTVVGGFLFGAVLGTLYATAAATIGTLCVVLFVRHGLQDLVYSYMRTRIDAFNHELAKRGHWYIIAVQIVPFTPAAMLSVLLGLSTLPLYTIAWTTAVGLLPGSFIYAFAGNQLHTISSVDDLLTWPIILLLLLLAGLVCVLAILHWLVQKRK